MHTQSGEISGRFVTGIIYNTRDRECRELSANGARYRAISRGNDRNYFERGERPAEIEKRLARGINFRLRIKSQGRFIVRKVRQIRIYNREKVVGVAYIKARS